MTKPTGKPPAKGEPMKPGRPRLPNARGNRRGARDGARVEVLLTAEEVARLDALRGSVPRSVWLAVESGLRGPAE